MLEYTTQFSEIQPNYRLSGGDLWRKPHYRKKRREVPAAFIQSEFPLLQPSKEAAAVLLILHQANGCR